MRRGRRPWYVQRVADPIDIPRPWPITRSEWDGLVVRTKRWDRLERWIPLIGSIGGAVTCFGGMRNAGVDGWALWAVPAVVAILAALFFGGLWFAMRSRRTPLGEVLARAWEGGGCVCPLCRGALPTPAADGAVPSCPHGLSVRDQPQLVEYWAACARRDDVTAHHILSSILAGKARPSLHVRLARLYTRNLSIALDQERRFLARYLAALKLLGLFGVPALAGLVPIFWSISGRALFMVIVFTVLQGVIVLPLALMSTPMRRRTRQRCAACSQMLASPHPARCPECGVDLHAPAAVTTSVLRFQFRYAAIAVVAALAPFVVGVGLLVFTAFGGARWLPDALLVPLAAEGGASGTIAREALDARSLSPTEAPRLADRLIARAERDLAQRTAPSAFLRIDHIPRAVGGGTLPREYMARALRASATFDVAREAGAGDARALRFTPRFGSDLFAPWGRAVLVLASVRFDDGEPLGVTPVPNFIDAETGMVVPVPAGARRAEWRARVCYLPWRAEFEPLVGSDGEFIGLEGNTDQAIIEGSLDLAP